MTSTETLVHCQPVQVSLGDTLGTDADRCTYPAVHVARFPMVDPLTGDARGFTPIYMTTPEGLADAKERHPDLACLAWRGCGDRMIAIGPRESSFGITDDNALAFLRDYAGRLGALSSLRNGALQDQP